MQTIDDEVYTIPAVQWNIAGTSVPKIDAQQFVTGQHKYASGIKLEGMVYGKILRPPAFGATLVSVNTSAAESIPGVVAVHDGDFIGVTAPSESIDERALKAIKAEWKTIPQPSHSELFDYLKNNTVEARGWRGSSPYVVGSIKEGLDSADKTLEATYTINYIAHAPMEPRAAVAKWDDGILTVWTGTQRPFGVQEELSRAFDIPVEKVRVIMPDAGSGYGGKHTGETAVEAARLAKATSKPVKLVWTREEEFTWAYFRPAGVIEVRGGVSPDEK